MRAGPSASFAWNADKICTLANMGNLETLSEYQRFAEQCDRLAQMAVTERDRKILERMAKAWRTVAEEENSRR
jgi:hypothetical protein